MTYFADTSKAHPSLLLHILHDRIFVW